MSFAILCTLVTLLSLLPLVLMSVGVYLGLRKWLVELRKKAKVFVQKESRNSVTMTDAWARCYLANQFAGQQEMVADGTLPAIMLGDTREQLEEWGVEILGPVEGDSLFVQVELPEGWKKVPTGDSYHSLLVDEKGKVRAMIFFKAAALVPQARMVAFTTTSKYCCE